MQRKQRRGVEIGENREPNPIALLSVLYGSDTGWFGPVGLIVF